MSLAYDLGALEERVLSITLSMHSVMRKQLDDFVESAFEIFDLRQQVTLYPHEKIFKRCLKIAFGILLWKR